MSKGFTDGEVTQGSGRIRDSLIIIQEAVKGDGNKYRAQNYKLGYRFNCLLRHWPSSMNSYHPIMVF